MNLLELKRKVLGHYCLKGDGAGGGGGGGDNADHDTGPADTGPAPSYSPGASDPAQQQQQRMAVAPAQSATPDSGGSSSPMAPMSQGFKMTEANANAIGDQNAVRQFLAGVEQDKSRALSNPNSPGNMSNPNIGTNVTNALQAAIGSGVGEHTISMSGGKNSPARDVTTLTSGIPIARFLGYTGEPGDAAISYGEAKQLQDAGLGNLTGVNLNNMPGAGLPVGGLTGLSYNQPGQTADSVVASTDAARFVERIWDAAKNFIPGYGVAQMAANIISGKMALGDLVVGIGVNKLAPMLGTTPAALTALANGNFADALTGQLAGYAVKDLSKTYGIDPSLVSMGLAESGLPQAVNKFLSPGNLNLGTTRALSNIIQSPINYAGSLMGVGVGSNTATGNALHSGDSVQEQLDRALGVGTSIPSFGISPLGTPSGISPLGTLSIPPIGAAGTPVGSADSSTLKESWLGGTGKMNTASPAKSFINPLSAGKAGVIKNEDTNTSQPMNYDSLKPDYYAYGGVPDISANLQLKSGGSISSPLVEASNVLHKASGGGIMVPPLMVAAGGDVPHKGSHYVQGAGGGQDDLIDARLADGEYVFDADVVSALGDGSNKEGAKKLDAMRESIRAHKRSAPASKIPPKAKSPLAYLKG